MAVSLPSLLAAAPFPAAHNVKIRLVRIALTKLSLCSINIEAMSGAA